MTTAAMTIGNVRKTRKPLPKFIRRLSRRWHWLLAAIPFAMLCVLAGGSQSSAIAGWLNANSPALSGIQNIVQAIFLCSAGALAYDRFFRGRAGVARAELGLTVKVIDGPPDHQLHIVELRLKNVGTPSIWSPSPELKLRHIGPANQPAAAVWQPLTLCETSAQANDVVDSGETIVFCAYCQVPNTCWAVEYEAVIRDLDETPWGAKVIAPNKERVA